MSCAASISNLSNQTRYKLKHSANESGWKGGCEWEFIFQLTQRSHCTIRLCACVGVCMRLQVNISWPQVISSDLTIKAADLLGDIKFTAKYRNLFQTRKRLDTHEYMSRRGNLDKAGESEQLASSQSP